MDAVGTEQGNNNPSTGQGPEWINRFNPTSLHEKPDIKAQVTPPAQEPGMLTPEQIQNILENMRRQMEGQYRLSSIEAFCQGLEALSYDDGKDKERTEKIRGELREKYEETVSQSISVSEAIYEAVIDRNINAYPYFNSPGEGFFGAIASRLNESRETSSMKEGSEAWVWQKRLERDIAWARSFFRASVGFSASSPANWDVIVQLQTLKQQRESVLTDDFEAIYAQTLPGLEFEMGTTQDQVKSEGAVIKEGKIGVNVPEKYVKKYGFSGEVLEGTKGTRELAVKLQNDSMAWRMRIAAVSQYDHNKPPEKTSFMGTNLQAEERQLITKLLGKITSDGEIQTAEVLNPFSASSEVGDQRKISAVLQALLRTNAFDRIQLGVPVEDVADDVSDVAEYIQNNWEKKEKGDPVARLAKLITKMGYLQDFSLLTAHDYCWSFVWERNISRRAEKTEKEWHVGKVKPGGINGPSGDVYSLNWARRKHIYDQQGDSSASELLPTSRKGRKEVKILPLQEMPKYMDSYLENLKGHPDKFLVEQWNFLFSDEPRWKKERAEMEYPDIPPNIKKVLMKWAYIWKTPFSGKFVGDGDYEIEIPTFAPPDLPIANMWNAVATDKETKIIHGAKSVWQQLIEGKKMSEIDWGKIDQKQVDRWLVDCEMASRFMRIFIEVVDKERDPLLSQLAGHPGTGPLKELAKRLRLAFRDSPDAPPTIYQLATIPWIITLVTANKHGISGSGAWLMLGEEDNRRNNCGLERFMKDMAAWKRAFKWLPGDRPELETKAGTRYDFKDLKYGETMALLAEFYEALLVRMAKASAEESVIMAQNNFDNTRRRLNQYSFINEGALKNKIKEQSLVDS